MIYDFAFDEPQGPGSGKVGRRGVVESLGSSSSLGIPSGGGNQPKRTRKGATLIGVLFRLVWFKIKYMALVGLIVSSFTRPIYFPKRTPTVDGRNPAPPKEP